MIDASLALRNLLRNRRRSLSTVLALAIGLAAILLFAGFRSNLADTMLTAYARAGGHLQVQQRDYFLYGSGNPAAYGIADYGLLIQTLRDDAVLGPMIDVATPVLRFGGIAGNFDAGISRTVIGTGLVASDVQRMRQWNEFDVPGIKPRFMLQGTAMDAAIVGIGVARVLQLCVALKVPNCRTPGAAEAGSVDRTSASLASNARQAATLPADIAALTQLDATPGASPAPQAGARIQLLSSSARGAPNVAALDVVAAEDQGFKELDEVSVIVHLAQAQQLVFGRRTPQATAIMILLRHTADQARAAARVSEILAAWHARASGTPQPLVVRSFGELNPFYVQSEQLFDVIFDFIFVLIGGIVLFTVGNTMNTAVVERTVEIGTLRAIGLRQSGVRRLFVAEGFVLGCVGAATGIVAAVVLGALVNHSGLTWLPPASSQRLPLQLRVLGDWPTVVVAALALVFVATASAWWPARRAARLNGVEALRHA